MDTTKLFEAALGVMSPWRVVGIEFEAGAKDGRGRLDIRLDFERGGELPCPECKKPCKAHDTDEQTWRHLNFFEHETYLVARTPRVKCEKHGVLKVEVPWARPGSGFTLLFEAYMMALAPEIPMAVLARMVGEHDTRLWRVVKHHVADARTRVDMSEVSSVVVDETSRAKRYSYVSLFLEPKKLDEDGEVTSDARVLFVTNGRSTRRSGLRLGPRDARREGDERQGRLHGHEPGLPAGPPRRCVGGGDIRPLPRDEARELRARRGTAASTRHAGTAALAGTCGSPTPPTSRRRSARSSTASAPRTC
jgi:hypothetical protein